MALRFPRSWCLERLFSTSLFWNLLPLFLNVNPSSNLTSFDHAVCLKPPGVRRCCISYTIASHHRSVHARTSVYQLFLAHTQGLGLRLPDWDPWDSPSWRLETTDDMAQCSSQWHSCIQKFSSFIWLFNLLPHPFPLLSRSCRKAASQDHSTLMPG